MDRLERAYEDFAAIAGSAWTPQMKAVALHDLYDSLGEDSVAFDNLVYERLGMSADEVIEMIGMGGLLP